MAPALEEFLQQQKAAGTARLSDIGDAAVTSLLLDLDVSVQESGSIEELLQQYNVPVKRRSPPAFNWTETREDEERDRYMQHLREHYPLPPPWFYGQINFTTTQSTPRLSGRPDVVVFPFPDLATPSQARLVIEIKKKVSPTLSEINQAIATHVALFYHAGSRPSFTFLTNLQTYWAVFYLVSLTDGRRRLVQRLTYDLAVAATMYEEVVQMLYRYTVRALASESDTPFPDSDNDGNGDYSERRRRSSRLQPRAPREPRATSTQRLDMKNISSVTRKRNEWHERMSEVLDEDELRQYMLDRVSDVRNTLAAQGSIQVT